MLLRRPRLLSSLLVAGSVMLGAASAFAHHGITTKFDPAQKQNLQGRVSRVDWANPHVHVFMVVEQNGQEEPWYVELESPQLLELNGWSEDTLKAGELLDVAGFRARDGSRQVWGDSVKRANQTILDTTKYP